MITQKNDFKATKPNGKYRYDYPMPGVTVDIVLFTQDQRMLLIQRAKAKGEKEPFKGTDGFWAIPGGFVEINESLEQAAARELREETGVENVQLQQFYTFGEPFRDSRQRIVSVCYFGYLPLTHDLIKLRAGDDASVAKWVPLTTLPKLKFAFDHGKIVKKIVDEVKKVLY